MARGAIVASRLATCQCGDVRITVEGEPSIISMCHCLLCQKRTGSTYSVHAYFPKDRVDIGGVTKAYSRSSDSGRTIEFHFCPNCGSTMFWGHPANASYVGIPVGVFADPAFPPPDVSIFMPHKHPWVVVPEGVPGYAAHSGRQLP
jgi:hypothetical protein